MQHRPEAVVDAQAAQQAELEAAVRERKEADRTAERARFDEPALADVRSWAYRELGRAILRELEFSEQVLLATPATWYRSGVVAVTSRSLLFAAQGLGQREPAVDRFPLEAVTVAKVREETGYAADVMVEVGAEPRWFEGIRPPRRAWELAGVLLARGGGSMPPAPSQCDVPDPAAVTEPEPTADAEIELTDEAAAALARSGGRLYLWQEDFGDMYALDKLDTEPPDKPVDFAEHAVGDVSIMVDTRLPPPSRVRVEYTHFLRDRFRVLWDGEQWGRRGAFPGTSDVTQTF